MSRSPSPPPKQNIYYRRDYSRSQHRQHANVVQSHSHSDVGVSVTASRGKFPKSHSSNANTQQKDHALHEKAHTIIGSSTNNGAGAGAASLNVRDLAKKLNNNVEKKSNVRPSWLKTRPTPQLPLLVVPNSNGNINGKSNSNVPDMNKKEEQHSSPTTTATTHISNSTNDANANDDQNAHLQPQLRLQQQERTQKQMQEQTQTPPKKKLEQEGVLHKAHFWRTQASQRISPKRERVTSPIVIKNSKPQSPPFQSTLPIHTEQEISTSSLLHTLSRHPFGKNMQDMEKRRKSKSPEYRHKHLPFQLQAQKKEEKQGIVSPSPKKKPNGLYTSARIGTRTQLQKKEEQQGFVSSPPKKESNGLYTSTRTSRENERFSPKKFTPKKCQFDKGLKEGDGDGGGDGDCEGPNGIGGNSTNINIHHSNHSSVPVAHMANAFSTPLRQHYNGRALGQRFQGNAYLSPSPNPDDAGMKGTRRVVSSSNVHIGDGGNGKQSQPQHVVAVNERSNSVNINMNVNVQKEKEQSITASAMSSQRASTLTSPSDSKSSFQSRIAQFSKKSSASPLSSTTAATFQRQNDISEGLAGSESTGTSTNYRRKGVSKDVSEDEEPSPKKEKDVYLTNENEGVKRQESSSSSSHYWKNQMKCRRRTTNNSLRDDTEEGSDHENPVRKSFEIQKDRKANIYDRSKVEPMLGRVTFAEALEETKSPPTNIDEHDTDASTKQNKNEGGASNKSHFWVSQQKDNKESTVSTRGRNVVASSRSRSLSQRRSSVEHAGTVTNAQSENSISYSKRSPSLSPPIKPDQVDTAQTKRFESKDEIMSTSLTGEVSSDKNEYMQYMSRNRRSRSKIDQPNVQSNFITNEDSADIEDNENFRNLIKSSMNKQNAGRKSSRQWPPPPQTANIMAASPAQMISALETAAHNPVKSSWSPRNAESETSTGNEVRKPEEKLGIKLHKSEVSPYSKSHLTEMLSNDANRIRAEDRELDRNAPQHVGQSNIYASEYAQHKLRNRPDNTTSTLITDSSLDESRSPLKSRWSPRNTETKNSTRNEVYKSEEKLGAKQHKNDIPLSSNTHPKETASNKASRIRAEDKCTDREVPQPVGQSNMLTREYAQRQLHNRRDNTATALESDLSSEGSAFVSSNQKVVNKSTFSWPPSESRKTQDTAATIPATPMRARTASTVVDVSNLVMTPRSAVPAATKTAVKEGDKPSETPIRHNLSSMSSPSSPIKSDRHEVASENATVITDSSSFLSVREVQKRLWDEGEKLKMWQKGNEHCSAQDKPSDDDKQSSLFKSRFYRAAEVAQKNCKENANSIPIPTNHQSVTKRDTIQPFDLSKGKDKIQDKAKDRAVAQLLAKLSSVKRDDPDEALRAIDSILEKHSEHSSTKKDVNQDEVNKSADSPILPPEYFEEDEQSVRKDDEDESSEYSDSDDSTVSSITNPTYMSGFGDCSPKSRKQQFGNLLSKDGRLKPTHHSTRPSSLLVKAAHPYSKRSPSELPPRRPHQPVPVSRNVKPLTGLQSTSKSRISRKSPPPPPPPPSAFTKTKPMVIKNHLKDSFEEKAVASTPRSTNVKGAKPTSPVKTLSAGGSSSNNRGLLNKFKDWGSDSDDKEDTGRPHEQKQNPGSPGERLKKLADAAQNLNNGQQSPTRNKVRRFLYPKRDPPPDETRLQGGNALGTTASSDNDAAWFPAESANFFSGEFFELERNSGIDPAVVEDIFDPFMEPSKRNNAFANEVLAEKFSRMEKAYQQ